MRTDWEIVVLGAGAAGCFFSANLLPEKAKNCVILEQGKSPLQKVRISGGGRCNVTHACFDARELTSNYPRGQKELLSVFSRFQPGDTFSWFEERNVPLKIEEDGRVFPESDTSQTIIDTFLSEMQQKDVHVLFGEKVNQIEPLASGFLLRTKNHTFSCTKLVVAAGGNPASWRLLEGIDLPIVPPVPSLFTFTISDPLLDNMQGISVPFAEVMIPQIKQEASGPLLITHWGLSGPAILRLSAWGARDLFELNYSFELIVNWIGMDLTQVDEVLKDFRNQNGDKNIRTLNPFSLPKRFWEKLCEKSKIPKELKFKQVQHSQWDSLLQTLTQCRLIASGKSTFKDEFVTAGGVDLRAIDFRTMCAKKYPNLYVLGEILNIDAITGGFNFQACWSEAWIAAQDVIKGE